MKVAIIRHTNSVGNALKIIDSIAPEFDKGLSEVGKKQAEELVPILKKKSFDVFIVSPLKRTAETLDPYF